VLIAPLLAQAIKSAMRTFYAQLFQSAGALVLLAERLASPRVRQQAGLRTARSVAATHRHIHELLSRPGAGYDDLGTILLHTAEEVDTLLEL